jgi:protein O-mannosyl-transferase
MDKHPVNSSKPITAPAVDGSPVLSGMAGRGLDFLRRYYGVHIGKGMTGRVRLGLGMLFIFALVFIVYAPILPGSFLMDDHRLIKDDNPLVNGELGPLNIWFQTDFTLSTFALWLQWLAWGEHPGGYHAVNMALHALSAVLLWRLLARLKIPGAWLAAVVFAVHPVCVNSVARIAEIKNTLSLPFFILSFWFYLRYEDLSLNPAGQNQIAGHHRRNHAALWYGFSLVAFTLALLSKTSMVMLPLVLLGSAAWQRGRITRHDFLQTAPYFILSLAFGLMTVWFQNAQALALIGLKPPSEVFWERLAVAGRVVWFYLGKALLPINLNLEYERWKPDPNALASFFPVFLMFVVFAVCWRFRRKWGRHLLFGLGCFVVTLFPVLGFFDSQFLTVWNVSDHLQYLPLIAPVALAIAMLASLVNPIIFRSVAVVLVLALSILTFQRAQVFSTEENLLRDTLAKNPAAPDAHNDLGSILANRQDYAGATAQFSAAVQSDPDNAAAHLNLGQALAMNGEFAGAEPHFLAAIRLKPGDPLAHKRFADALSRQGKNREAMVQLQVALSLSAKPDIETRLDLAELLYQTGNARQAADQFRKVLLLNPDLPEALNNLAWLLATSSDGTVRDGTEAVRDAERACRLTGFKRTEMISTLAAAYAEAGRYSEAVATAEMAIRLQTANGETRLAEINSQLLRLYRAGMPYHEKPAVDKNP